MDIAARLPVWEIIDEAIDELCAHHKTKVETVTIILKALYMVTPQEKEIIKKNNFSLGNIRFERFYSKQKNK